MANADSRPCVVSQGGVYSPFSFYAVRSSIQILARSSCRKPPLPRPPADSKKIKHVVGNTPLLEIHFRYRGRLGVMYAKAEHRNLTGSIKDRIAFHIKQSAYRARTLSAGALIAEATSGNAGISFSAFGRSLGRRVVIFMPDWMSRERVDLIRSLGVLPSGR